MFVLGTAGHIDHGKSSLIQAMTGINPDRLPEEQERGMTIDLGFAWMKLRDGQEIGIIDVPGHERFVRNMVAGAGGINAAMLVIAADDGWMPQTQEHLDILNLLGISHGLVALTKIDLVEPDWVELVMADISGRLEGTCLESAEIVPVSSTTGEGVDRIREVISEIASRLQQVEDIGKSRLFIDRVFILTGIGVVVTGTSRGGGFTADGDTYHFPSGRKLRIRSLQSHERQVTGVGAGTRVAINLTGVDRDDISRGELIMSSPIKHPRRYFAALIKNLTSTTFTLKEGRKVLMILGTTETDAILRPFDDKGIKPGEEGLAIIKTELPVAGYIMDNFILRLRTPQVTIGGGKILDVLNSYPRRKDLAGLAPNLEKRVSGDLTDLVETEISKRLFVPRDGFLMESDFAESAIAGVCDTLIEQKRIYPFDTQLGNAGRLDEIFSGCEKELARTHRNKSYLKGLTSDQLAKKFKQIPDDEYLMALRFFEHTKKLGRTQQFYHLPDFSPVLDEAMKRQAETILAAVTKAGHNYLTLENIEKEFPGSRNTINFLRDEGRIKMVANSFVMSDAIWKTIMAFIERKLASGGRVTVAEFRDEFGSSRKYSLPILEFLDSHGITTREGDYRVRGGRFDERNLI